MQNDRVGNSLDKKLVLSKFIEGNHPLTEVTPTPYIPKNL